jgi:aspartate carbamoyltransferase catalytic subunit
MNDGLYPRGTLLFADRSSFLENLLSISIGDGTAEHPSQALLDVFTIKTELGVVGSPVGQPPMVITLLGDLKNGRTVHSLVKLLKLFPGIRLQYVCPSILAMPQEIIDDITAAGIEQSVVTLEEAIGNTDVLYATRVQKERFASIEDYNAVAGSYCVDAALLTKVH